MKNSKSIKRILEEWRVEIMIFYYGAYSRDICAAPQVVRN